MQFSALCALFVSLFAASSGTVTTYNYCRCIPRPSHYLRGLGEETAPDRNLYTETPVCPTSHYYKSTL
jgi:hypothetical protein